MRSAIFQNLRKSTSSYCSRGCITVSNRTKGLDNMIICRSREWKARPELVGKLLSCTLQCYPAKPPPLAFCSLCSLRLTPAPRAGPPLCHLLPRRPSPLQPIWCFSCHPFFSPFFLSVLLPSNPILYPRTCAFPSTCREQSYPLRRFPLAIV